MSIAVLGQVYDEARRLSIAGSNLACGDFRLKKLIEPLEKAGEKAPVFAAVAKAVDRLVSGSEKDSAQSLLDLSSLVLAILYTQGQTGASGELKPIESKEMSLQTTQMSARVLKPLIEALTSTGSGRLETIRDAFERGAFQDLRLVNPALHALDDSYGEIADFVADKILPIYGSAVIPEIRHHIDIKGKGGSVRRLRILYSLDPAVARSYVQDAFENGSKEMKIAALGCLGDSPEDLPHLLEQASAKAKDVRRVAIRRLVGFADDQSVAILSKALKGADLELAVQAISQTKSKKLWDEVLQYTGESFAELFKIKDKAKLGKALYRMYDLLSCFFGRNDKGAVDLLNSMYDQRDALTKLKAPTASGNQVLGKLCHTMLISGVKKLQQRLIDDREKMEDDGFVSSFAAAVMLLGPKQVYDDYSRFFISNPNKRRGSSRRDMMQMLLAEDFDGITWYDDHGLQDASNNSHLKNLLKSNKWDPRWLDAAIQINDLECALRFGNPKHAGLKKYLDDRFAEVMKAKDFKYEVFPIVGGMIEFGYPQATDRLIDTIKKQAKSSSHYYYYYYSVAPLISKLPKSSAAKIEALLPELPERLIDYILPHLETLKRKAK